MIIRDAQMQDAVQLDMLLSRLIQDESQYDGNLNRVCEIRDNYCNRIGLDGHKLILAEEEGEIAGYLYGFLYHIPGVYEEPIAIVDALYIAENHRRKGYASQLLFRFQAFAAENGACRLELKVISKNEAALALYRKMSFTETKKYMMLGL